MHRHFSVSKDMYRKNKSLPVATTSRHRLLTGAYWYLKMVICLLMLVSRRTSIDPITGIIGIASHLHTHLFVLLKYRNDIKVISTSNTRQHTFVHVYI